MGKRARDLERECEDLDDGPKEEGSESDPKSESESEPDSEPDNEDMLREPNKSREFLACHARKRGERTSATFLTLCLWTIFLVCPSRVLSPWL